MFYVPKGTKVIGGYSAAPVGLLVNPAGETAHDFAKDGKPGYFSVPVRTGVAGAWWRFTNVKGNKLLLTVPPYLSCSAEEGVVPREVHQADAAGNGRDRDRRGS
jgi:hypothetical protein